MNRYQLKMKKLRKVYREKRKAEQREAERKYHTWGAYLEREAERERRMAK